MVKSINMTKEEVQQSCQLADDFVEIGSDFFVLFHLFFIGLRNVGHYWR